ncbi:hypothetical protein S83_000802, partial [Arachis hypogaea]
LAHKVFEKMSERSEVSWNIMIDSYASAGYYMTSDIISSIIQSQTKMLLTITQLSRTQWTW